MNSRIWIVAALPICIAIILCCFSFGVDLNALLTLFLPVVWSILFTLGGAIVFMRTRKFSADWQKDSDQEFTRSFIALSIVLILQTVLFLLLSLMYPARNFLVGLLASSEMLNPLIPKLICAYKSLLFSLIVVPSIASLFVGIWILYLVLNPEAEKKHDA